MEQELNLLIVSCSQRNDSKSLDLSKHILKHLLEPHKNSKTTILNLADYPFLMNHYGYDRNDQESLSKNKQDVLHQLYNCDAVVFVVPEWGGMVPPALVNLLLLTANGSAQGLPLGHKPGFIVGVSASGGGNYPISLLKGYAAKNSHITWTPLHAIVSNVNDFLQHPWSPDSDHRFSQVQSRLRTGLKSLMIYARALKDSRNELVLLSQVHPFGQ